jgi:hypothetical protein
MKKVFTISAAYNWSKDSHGINKSELAIKAITNHLKNRFSNNQNENLNYKINYRRLRASAGRNMLDSITKRIITSNVVIIDLTVNNNNVYLEAGIALALIKFNECLSVYFIKEKDPNKKLPEGIPSDLHGYFISEYECDVKKEIITFKDNNSLRMSMESDVKEYFSAFNEIQESDDEINYKNNE